MKSSTRRPIFLFVACLVIYAAGVAAFSYWQSCRARQHLLSDIDHQLIVVAKALKYTLAPDFHDRATGPESISLEEEMANRAVINRLAADTEFVWLYTLAEKDGKFYFSAPTVTEEEATERKRWYWLPYDDISPAFVKAFQDNFPAYAQYTDKWGTFRSIALPQTSPGGRRYLACADVDISWLRAMLREEFWESVLIGSYFLLLVLPFIFAFLRYNRDLRVAHRELTRQSLILEQMVEERTADLQEAKAKAESLVTELQHALSEVKKLSGLLPICSHCKKVRDDQGYWNQIEEYIRDHSEARFSHGICPECMKKYYPEYHEP